MKIQIDLNDIFQEEGYTESLNESIRRQVIDAVKADSLRRVGEMIKEEMAKVIHEQVSEQVKLIAPKLCNELVDLEYQPITSYGSKDGGPTTMRKKFIEELKKEFVYKPNTPYPSDMNAFTKAIKQTVEQVASEARKDMSNKINQELLNSAYVAALEKIKEMLRVKG